MKKVRFNGRITKSGGGGCVPCGTKRKGTSTFSTTTSLVLPSGAFKTFRKGHITEVADTDFDYLMLYGSVEVDGTTKPVFEVVE